jgi:uncharacterized membrane protein (DUF2068 family)
LNSAAASTEEKNAWFTGNALAGSLEQNPWNGWGSYGRWHALDVWDAYFSVSSGAMSGPFIVKDHAQSLRCVKIK